MAAGEGGRAASARAEAPPARPRFFSAPPIDRAVEATPPERDRVVDAARAAALLVVVLGHGVMAVAAWPDGVPRLGNLLAAFPWTQGLTWVLQIMPLFFWAGGAANAMSWRGRRAGTTYAGWIWSRGRRLLRPVIVYLVVMGIVATVVTVLAPAAVAEPLMALTTQLLWFLGAYLITVALTPWLAGRSAGHDVLVVVTLLAVAAVIDVGRLILGWPEALGLVNFVVVWTVPALLGVMRAQGRLAGVRTPGWLAVVVVTVAANAVLIHEGPWPVSMVGMPGEPVSNMAPPTIVLGLHCLTLVAVVQVLDRPLRALLEHRALWRPVVAVNLTAMTLYLWHLPALIALTVAAHVLHLDRPVGIDAAGFPAPDGWGYGGASLLFWAVYALAVLAVVRLMWPFEYVPLPWWDSPARLAPPPGRTAGVIAAVGVLLVGVATLVLSAAGLGGFPTRVITYAGLPLSAPMAIGGLLLGGALMRWAGADQGTGPASRSFVAGS